MNASRPQGRKDWVVVAAMLAALAGGTVAAKHILLSGAAETATARAEAGVLVDINRQRIARGLPPLKLDPKLRGVARSWSTRMIVTGNFAHGDWDKRIYAAVGRRNLIAEDLGVTSPGVNGVVQAWMNSPPHRKNILLRDARRVGVGVSLGTYKGHSNTAMITADFSS